MPIESTPRPIFIIGAPRSGTSILTWCLAQHSNILIVPETNWIAALSSQLDHLYKIGSISGYYTQLSNFEIDRDTFFQSFGRTVHRIIKEGFEKRYSRERERLRQGGEPKPVRAWITEADDPKERWVDGAPVNSTYVAAIDAMFPAARYLHLTRAPELVINSLISNAKLAEHFPTPEKGVEYIFHTRRVAHLAEVALGREKVIRADLARILSSPDAELSRILEHLGEQYEKVCKKPLCERINSTEQHGKLNCSPPRDTTSKRMIRCLEEWHEKALNPDWTLPVDVEFAREELLTYASFPMSAPPSEKQLRLDL